MITVALRMECQYSVEGLDDEAPDIFVLCIPPNACAQPKINYNKNALTSSHPCSDTMPRTMHCQTPLNHTNQEKLTTSSYFANLTDLIQRSCA